MLSLLLLLLSLLFDQVNFSTLLIENIQDTFGGTAWALAASPRDEVLAVGCEDGMVRLFRYDQQRSSNSNSSNSGGSSGGGGNSGGSAGGLSGAAALFGATGPAAGSRGALEYERALPTSGDRVLCLCYHPTEPLIFVGCGDGVVRCMEEVPLALHHQSPHYITSYCISLFCIVLCCV